MSYGFSERRRVNRQTVACYHSSNSWAVEGCVIALWNEHDEIAISWP